MTQKENKKRIVVAMSGGVDSSVAAALLSEKGYEVIGITMKMFETKEHLSKFAKSCCSPEDVNDARMVCKTIGAKHYFLNFVDEFKQHVIDYFVSEYEKGRTPHPCLACNDKMKFDFLYKRATLMETDLIATGHYAQIENKNNQYFLKKGVEDIKDQSYVLYNLKQEQMKSIYFPVGKYSKAQIREIAKQLGLITADKPDSQDICFIPSGDYKRFIENKINNPIPGKIFDSEGMYLGNHDGIHNFTVGQRRGIPINISSKRPMYVSDINTEDGTVIMGFAEKLLHDTLLAKQVNWISGQIPTKSMKVLARIRYNGNDTPAKIFAYKNSVIVKFEKHVRAITPGQPVVFFDNSTVLGGGIIEKQIQSNIEDINSANKILEKI